MGGKAGGGGGGWRPQSSSGGGSFSGGGGAPKISLPRGGGGSAWRPQSFAKRPNIPAPFGMSQQHPAVMQANQMGRGGLAGMAGQPQMGMQRPASAGRPQIGMPQSIVPRAPSIQGPVEPPQAMRDPTEPSNIFDSAAIKSNAMQIKESSPSQIQPLLQIPGASPAGGNSFQPTLGNISGKYESNGKWDTISSGKGDPGGVSYGKYQLASKTGTLNRFLQNSGFGQAFAGARPGTSTFNSKWKDLSGNVDFQQAQHDFIKKSHFEPVRNFATKMGLPNHPAVNEALWSMGVQHGGATKIVNRAFKGQDVSNMSAEQIVNRLYDARGTYVSGLSKVPQRTKQSILRRYRNELDDVLDML